MKKTLLILFMGMFLISFISGAISFLGTFQENSDINLIQVCNCTFNNITVILDPDGNILLSDLIMNRSGTYFNYTLNSSFTNLVGIYTVNGIGDLDGPDQPWNYNFEITDKKLALDTPEALLYFLLTFGVFIVFLFSFYFAVSIPYSNKINDKGAVIKVTKLKYVKLGFIMISYVLFVWVLNVLIGISDNFVSLSMFYGFVSFFFQLLNNLALPFSIFIIVLSGYEIVRDTNISKAIKKFGSHKK